MLEHFGSTVHKLTRLDKTNYLQTTQPKGILLQSLLEGRSPKGPQTGLLAADTTDNRHKFSEHTIKEKS